MKPLYYAANGRAGMVGGASTEAARSADPKGGLRAALRTAGGSPPRGAGEGAWGDDWVASITREDGVTYDILACDVPALSYFAEIADRSDDIMTVIEAEAAMQLYLEEFCRLPSWVFDLHEWRWGSREEFDSRDTAEGFGAVEPVPEQPHNSAPVDHLPAPAAPLQLRFDL